MAVWSGIGEGMLLSLWFHVKFPLLVQTQIARRKLQPSLKSLVPQCFGCGRLSVGAIARARARSFLLLC